VKQNEYDNMKRCRNECLKRENTMSVCGRIIGHKRTDIICSNCYYNCSRLL